MIAEPFATQTGVLGTRPCIGLPVAATGTGTFTSCWTLTWAEALGLLFGRRVWLTVHSQRHPPVALEVHPAQPLDLAGRGGD